MKRVKLSLILLMPIGFLINLWARNNEMFVEEYYSRKFYRWISIFVSQITGWISVSVAEVGILIFSLFVILLFVKFIIGVLENKTNRLKLVKKYLINLLVFLSVVYFIFIGMWGLNYNRNNLTKIMELEVKPSPIEELVELNKVLVNQAATLRLRVEKNEKDVVVPFGDYTSVFMRANKGYEKASAVYDELGGTYGNPKGVLLSNFMSYTGIWGIYSPFTVESNVNISIPSFMLPSTACHEMAHQRGFAREDEANYISYLACSMHPDDDFKYSGNMLALINTMNALYANDSDIYKKLYAEIDQGIKRDLKEIDEFNKKHDGKIQKASTKTNDIYLKANNQKDGEKSYGRVVDWLLADYRSKSK